MKKILVGLAVLGLMVACASAGVNILWSVTWGAYSHASPNVTGGSNALLDSYSVTWQLIYAGINDTIDPVSTSIGGVGIADDYVTGDDVVWASRSLSQSIAQGNVTAPEDGSIWSNWMINQAGDIVYENTLWSTAGYVFQRVFEGTPTELSWYYQSELVPLDTGSPSPPQSIYLGGDNSGFKPDRQISVASVPEPATMGLLGLGALVMAIRRRRS